MAKTEIGYDPRSASLRAIRSTYRRRVAGKRWGGVPEHDKKSRGDTSGSKQDASAARMHPRSMTPPDRKPPKSSGMPAMKGGSPRRSREGGMSYASRTEKYADDGVKTSRKAASSGRFRSFRDIVKATVNGRRPLKRKALPKSSKPPSGSYK